MKRSDSWGLYCSLLGRVGTRCTSSTYRCTFNPEQALEKGGMREVLNYLPTACSSALSLWKSSWTTAGGKWWVRLRLPGSQGRCWALWHCWAAALNPCEGGKTWQAIVPWHRESIKYLLQQPLKSSLFFNFCLFVCFPHHKRQQFNKKGVLSKSKERTVLSMGYFWLQ